MIARKKKNNLKNFQNNKFTILINRANECDNPLNHLNTIKEFNIENKIFMIDCARSSKLSDDIINWAVNLTAENMREFYEQTEWGWNVSNKRKELTHKTAYFLLVKDKLEDKNCAFAHFRFEFDDAKIKGVCYCYELQISKDYQRKGIGSLLMELIKKIGIKMKMSKVMLTCIGYNQSAMNFYTKKLGYHIDQTSPSKCVEGKTFYEILSFKID